MFCRCRYDDTEACTLKFQEEKVFCVTNQGRKKEYEFEKVYGPDTTQEKVIQIFIQFVVKLQLTGI